MIGEWAFIMNSRILMITGTTDMLRSPTETDNTMEEVFNLTLPSKLRYVEKHGYDILSLRSFGKDNKYGFEETDLGYLRVVRCFEMLEYYDSVMWIDADSLITNYNYSITDFEINSEHSFYASWDWVGKQTFSTGNFIVHRGNNFEELFSTFLHASKYVIETKQWGWEQTTMNLVYRNTPLQKSIKILDHKFLGSIPSKQMYNGIWNGRNDPLYPWTKDSFLVHITGVPNKNRIDVINTSFKEYI